MSAYWITDLNTGSCKSPYAIRMTLSLKPNNEDEIKKWMLTSFGKFGYIFKIIDMQFFYAEIYFKEQSDASAFMLKWGDSLVDPAGI